MTLLFHQLKNHIRNDPLSDWFSMVNETHDCYQPDDKSTFEIEMESRKESYTKEFYSFLFKHKEVFFYSDLDADQTKAIIHKKEHCIMINCTLYHQEYDLLVKPHLIIHRSIFKQIFPLVSCELPEFIVIDILYKIINFSSDKQDILNQDTIFYHKCKMYVASQCVNPRYTHGYFFGKEYRHKGITVKKREHIGIFPFNCQMKEKVIHGIKWFKKLQINYESWLIYPKPSVKELYPNMNIKTGRWFNEKKQLAELINEITLVWNISYDKRCVLLEKGIYTWDDPILLHNIYPFQVKESKREYIQEKMIHINSQEELKIQPRRIKNSDFIHHIQTLENSIVLDIESVLNLDEKESYFTERLDSEDPPRICIIGTILLDNDNIFKDFTIRYLNNTEEKIIIQYWLTFLFKYFKEKPIKVFHWGNAEKVYLEYMKQKYPDLKYPTFEMIDLVEYFKKEPITIQGCFGYGLKEIVKQLYSHKLIDHQWTDDTDGLEAMIQIMKKSEDAESKNIPLKRFTEIKKIIYYNYMDCKVVSDILMMLQKMI